MPAGAPAYFNGPYVRRALRLVRKLVVFRMVVEIVTRASHTPRPSPRRAASPGAARHTSYRRACAHARGEPDARAFRLASTATRCALPAGRLQRHQPGPASRHHAAEGAASPKAVTRMGIQAHHDPRAPAHRALPIVSGGRRAAPVFSAFIVAPACDHRQCASLRRSIVLAERRRRGLWAGTWPHLALNISPRRNTPQ